MSRTTVFLVLVFAWTLMLLHLGLMNFDQWWFAVRVSGVALFVDWTIGRP